MNDKIIKKKQIVLPDDFLVTGKGRWQQAFNRFKKNKAAVLSLLFIILISLACFLLPNLLPHKFDTVDYYSTNLPPSFKDWHLFGTDYAGRDLLVRTLIGGRVSLIVGLLAAFLSVTFGLIYGAVSGFVGSYVDNFMMRFVDIMYSIPYLVMAILVVTILGQDIHLVIFTITILSWMDVARVVRGQTLSLKKQEFIEAAYVIGASRTRIIFKHIIPNLVGLVAVYATITIPTAIIVESVLSFLGLGVQEPFTSWGLLINDGTDYMEIAPWLLIMPGFMLSATLFSANYLGDGLRDALDPRQDIKHKI